MKTLWKFTEELDISKTAKIRLFLMLTVVISTLAGAAVWLLAGRIFLPGIIWMLCFAGYPAIFIGIFASVIYLYNNDFTENIPGRR